MWGGTAIPQRAMHALLDRRLRSASPCRLEQHRLTSPDFSSLLFGSCNIFPYQLLFLHWQGRRALQFTFHWPCTVHSLLDRARPLIPYSHKLSTAPPGASDHAGPICAPHISPTTASAPSGLRPCRPDHPLRLTSRLPCECPTGQCITQRLRHAGNIWLPTGNAACGTADVCAVTQINRSPPQCCVAFGEPPPLLFFGQSTLHPSR